MDVPREIIIDRWLGKILEVAYVDGRVLGQLISAGLTGTVLLDNLKIIGDLLPSSPTLEEYNKAANLAAARQAASIRFGRNIEGLQRALDGAGHAPLTEGERSKLVENANEAFRQGAKDITERNGADPDPSTSAVLILKSG